MNQSLSSDQIAQLNAELAALDQEQIDIGGKLLAPSQCYRMSNSLPHILFNTNCPDSLKTKLESILSKYNPGDESRS